MKKFLRPLQISILTILLLLPNTFTAFAEDTMVKFTSKEGNFSIKFPGEPTYESQNIGTEDDPITMHLFTYSINDDEAKIISYTDYDIDTDYSKKEAYDFLKNEQTGELNVVGLKKASQEKKNTYKNHPGLSYRYKNKSLDYHYVIQTYLVKNRLYQMMMLQTKSFPKNSEIKSFVGSFKLLNQ